MLKSDADTLIRLVEETKNDPRNLRAVDAANRYQTIVNTINKAKELADKADLVTFHSVVPQLSLFQHFP